MNHFAGNAEDAPEFNEVDNDEGMTSFEKEQIAIVGATDLDGSEQRAYDTDEEEGSPIFSSSDDTAEDDEEDKDAKPAKSNKRVGDKKAGASTSEDNSDDADFALGQDNDDDDAAPVQKKAKKSHAKVEAVSQARTQTTMSQFKAQQAAHKRKRTEALKDPSRTESAFIDYIFVATMQATGVAPNFREIVLSTNADADTRAGRLARSIAEIEALINESLTLAKSATPAVMQEIIDFVKGAVELDVGDQSYAVGAKRCDLTLKAATSSMLECMQALHAVKRGGTTTMVKKRKVVLIEYEELIKAVWVAVNFLDIAEAEVKKRLGSIKGFVNGETTAADAAELLCQDTTKKTALKTVLRSKLQTALNKLDMSAKLLDK